MSALALVSTLTACGTQDQPANNVAAENDMNAMMADSGPFTDVEMRMNDAMMAAVGVNAGDSWVRKMIEHHRGAVEMSRIVLTQSPTADVAKMAQDTIDKQGREITDLEKLIATGTPDPASSELYRPASMAMHDAMMAAKGPNVSDTYLRKMLEHHKGAVAMSDVALANRPAVAVRARVEKTKATQQMEVAMVEAMLRGEPMMTMAPAPANPEAAKTTANPTATAKPVATKTSPKPKTPAPAADPHAGMDMNNM